MSDTGLKIAFATGALLGVPALFGSYVWTSYYIALSHGTLPFYYFPDWQWFVAYATSLVLGLVVVFLSPIKINWLRIVIGMAYLPVMAFALLWVNLFIACANGDCI